LTFESLNPTFFSFFLDERLLAQIRIFRTRRRRRMLGNGHHGSFNELLFSTDFPSRDPDLGAQEGTSLHSIEESTPASHTAASLAALGELESEMSGSGGSADSNGN